MVRLRLEPHFQADSDPIEETTKEKFIFYPRALNITWGNDKRYWRIPDRPDTKKEAEDNVAELKQVSWLEVTGSTKDNLKKDQWYKVGFKVSLRADAFGWDECNVYIMAKIGKKGKFSFQKLSLNNGKSPGEKFYIPEEDELKIQVKPNENSDYKLYFGMYEVWSRRWKGGLKIHHAFVEKTDQPNKK